MKTSVYFLVLALAFVSCKKNQLGGKSSVHFTVKHHNKFIPNSRVFVKFGAKDFPGKDTTKYDERIVTDASAHGSFNCYKGDYYLYGYGYDPGVPGVVTGGLHLRVRNNEEISTDVAVTED